MKMTAEIAARRIGVTADAIRGYISQHQLPVEMAGNRMYIPKESYGILVDYYTKKYRDGREIHYDSRGACVAECGGCVHQDGLGSKRMCQISTNPAYQWQEGHMDDGMCGWKRLAIKRGWQGGA